MRQLAPALFLLAACAPPIGVGPAPNHLPARAALASMSTSYALGGGRETVQASGSVEKRLLRYLAIEGGLVSTVTRVDADRKVVATGAFPYARPTLILGPVRLGVALSGFALGAGGGGVTFGVAEGRVSVQQKNAGMWLSALAFSSESIGGPRSTAQAAAVGFEVRLKRAKSTFGLGFEARSGRDEYACGDRCATRGSVAGHFSSIALRLRLIGGLK